MTTINTAQVTNTANKINATGGNTPIYDSSGKQTGYIDATGKQHSTDPQTPGVDSNIKENPDGSKTFTVQTPYGVVERTTTKTNGQIEVQDKLVSVQNEEQAKNLVTKTLGGSMANQAYIVNTGNELIARTKDANNQITEIKINDLVKSINNKEQLTMAQYSAKKQEKQAKTEEEKKFDKYNELTKDIKWKIQDIEKREREYEDKYLRTKAKYENGKLIKETEEKKNWYENIPFIGEYTKKEKIPYPTYSKEEGIKLSSTQQRELDAINKEIKETK